MQRSYPTAPAMTILTEIEIRTLLLLTPQPSEAQLSDFCVSQAVRAIAKLGGFLARKGDGDPEPMVIWRGWTVLQNATLLGSRLFPKICG